MYSFSKNAVSNQPLIWASFEVGFLTFKIAGKTPDKSHMDIGGISKLRNIIPFLKKEGVQRNNESSQDRDSQGSGGYQKNPNQGFLTTEQEESAVKKLNDLPAFKKAGLTAFLVRESGRAPHVVVKDNSGHIVRQLPYDDLIQMYLDRNLTQKESGRILNRAA
jgi:hypothetical protein